MEEIAIVSGKGGAGKTSIVGGIISILKDIVIADCDVDAPDMYIILSPEIEKQIEFYGGRFPVLDQDKCINCGICGEKCRFDAVHTIGDETKINYYRCDGCGVCSRICPVNAIKMESQVQGYWYISNTRYGKLIHAKLGIAQENSGKLVNFVRAGAKDRAREENAKYIIIDGPPGVGCPAISSLTGVNKAIIVVEPTLSGIHDAKRILQVIRGFKIKTGIIINKSDINQEMAQKVKNFSIAEKLPILGEIPYDKSFTEAIIQKKTIVEYNRDNFYSLFSNIWKSIQNM